MDYKSVLGIISVIIATIGYIPYIRDVLRHKTHPHAYTWLTWSILAIISFGVQVTHDAGAGSWAWLLCIFATLLIFVLSFFYGEKDIKKIDTLGLLGAMTALVMWIVVDQPFASVVLISIVEVSGGFFPTFRKSYMSPEKETISIYLMSALYMFIAVLALDDYSLINIFYPAVCITMSISLACFLKIRRVQLGTTRDTIVD